MFVFQGNGEMPLRVKVEPVSRPLWLVPKAINRIADDLIRSGFAEQGVFTSGVIGILYWVFYHDALDVIATVEETAHPLYIWVKLCTRYQDGTEFWYSTSNLEGILQLPPYRTVVVIHQAQITEIDDINAIIDDHVAHRPKKPIAKWDGCFAAWAEDVYA